jgi:SAM-dependent methyltransferase
MTAWNPTEIAPSLELRPEGYWTSKDVAVVSYPEEGNDLCFSVEDSSFWFRHRNRCILAVIQNFPPNGAVFDVGGGNGYVASALQQTGIEVVLVEPGLAGIRNALKRGINHIVRGTLDDVGVLANSIPAAGLFDVVEHIQDAPGFLRRIRPLIVPGGRLYVTVPAYEWLWSEEDIQAGHWRRYTVKTLRQTLEDAGYEVEFASYFFSFLPVPILVRRALPYRLGFGAAKPGEKSIRSDHEVKNSFINQMLRRLTSGEVSRIAQLKPIRVGTSCLAVARRPKG